MEEQYTGEKKAVKNSPRVIFILVLLGVVLLFASFFSGQNGEVISLTPELTEERKNQILDKREVTAEILEFITDVDTGEEVLRVSALIIDESHLSDIDFSIHESIDLPTVWKEYELVFDEATAIDNGGREDLFPGAYVQVTTDRSLLSEGVHSTRSIQILQ